MVSTIPHVKKVSFNVDSVQSLCVATPELGASSCFLTCFSLLWSKQETLSNREFNVLSIGEI